MTENSFEKINVRRVLNMLEEAYSESLDDMLLEEIPIKREDVKKILDDYFSILKEYEYIYNITEVKDDKGNFIGYDVCIGSNRTPIKIEVELKEIDDSRVQQAVV
jgi:division protein CdvB (Snf7/Vps24/ESCRT-III family)